MAQPDVQHVFVLQLENRSFDHVLGSRADVDGVDANRSNRDAAGRTHFQQRLSGPNARAFRNDPPHDSASVARQMAAGMSGFVTEYQRAHPKNGGLNPGDVMGYLTADDLPVTHFLADNFAVSDRWFTAIPTQTMPNRLYSMYGHSCGTRDNPTRMQYVRGFADNDSIFDKFNAANIPWRVYAGAMPGCALIRSIRGDLFKKKKLRRLKDFESDLAAADSNFPKLVWIEPSYSWTENLVLDPFFPEPNDDHPPSDVHRGQALIARLYEALRKSAIWSKSVFVIFYDEHGGFYDHVVPPRAPVQADKFDQRGPRVPALVISPFVKPGANVRPPVGACFDHCSVLRYLCDLHGIPQWTARIADSSTASLSEFLHDQALANPLPIPVQASAKLAASDVELPAVVENVEAARERIAENASLVPTPHAAGLDDLRIALEREYPDEYREIYPDLAEVPPIRPAAGAMSTRAGETEGVGPGGVVPPDVPTLSGVARAPAALPVPAGNVPTPGGGGAEEELRALKDALGSLVVEGLVRLGRGRRD